jgi:hypothetical protein
MQRGGWGIAPPPWPAVGRRVHGTFEAVDVESGIMVILPVSRFGRLACWLALAFLVLFGALALLSSQQSPGATPAWLKAFGGVVFATGFAGGVVAVVALVKQRDRAVLNFLALLPALFVVGFLLFAE